LVDNLLVLARLDEKTEISKTKSNLVAVTKEVGKDIELSTGVKIAVTDFEGKEISSHDAMVDVGAIRQVLINLLTNASRFSNKKQTVVVAFSKVGKFNVFEVRDSGPGIPSNLRDKVFERFYRADNSRNRETGGSGLGLAIVKAIVERHGGSISALETPGGGATFRVELP